MQQFSWEIAGKAEERALQRKNSEAMDNYEAECAKNPARILDASIEGKVTKEEWDKAFEKRSHETCQGVSNVLKKIQAGDRADSDAALLLKLLGCEEDVSQARQRLLQNETLSLSTLALAHRGDPRASGTRVGRSVRRVLAACAESAESVCVMNAETGHMALEVARTAGNLKKLSLMEDDADYRAVSDALCKLVAPEVAVESVARNAASNAAGRCDVVLLEASGVEMPKKDDMKSDPRSLFRWQDWDSCRAYVHVPPGSWDLLRAQRSNISAILQLPPLLLPTTSQGRQEGNYAPCEQGIIAVIERQSLNGKRVRIIDATMINGGKAAAELDDTVVKELALALTTGGTPAGCGIHEVGAGRLFGDVGTPWPSLLTLLGRKPSREDEPASCSLETLLEDLAYHDHAWKRSQGKLLKSIGVRALI